MIRLYLDIDGVLLTKDHKIPEDADIFIPFVLRTFDCYWLTTHCKGDASTALHYLSAHFPPEWIVKLKEVKPTNWDALKTEGIDFTKDFFWLDDAPFAAEQNILAPQGALDRLLVVDLKNNYALSTIMGKLIEKQAARFL
jgi:hypothetical protein